MRIGIDISQLAYPNTGVATYLSNLIHKLVEQDTANEYVLFYASLRRPLRDVFTKKNVDMKKIKFPPTLLHILWNVLHIVPIETFTGPLDVFISSDWTQPPTRAKKITIIYDMVVYTYPNETAGKIVSIQKKRLEWVRKEVDRIICISQASKKDVVEILKIAQEKITVVYPGL